MSDSIHDGAAESVKKAGLPSLDYVVNKTGQSRQTLRNWAKSKPELFAVVVVGCQALYAREKLGSENI